MTWYTLHEGVVNQSEVTRALVVGPGTVRRIIFQLVGGHAATGVGTFGAFHWIINVGSAAADPSVFGEDSTSTMLHGGVIIPDSADLPVVTQAPGVDLDSDGDRVMTSAESLWLRIRAAAPTTAWAWAWTTRVLVL